MFTANRCSKESASFVARALEQFQGRPDDFFKLATVTYRSGEEIARPDIWIRLQAVDDISQNKTMVTNLANGAEIAHCITNTGQRVDILLGKPSERALQPALVILEEDK